MHPHDQERPAHHPDLTLREVGVVRSRLTDPAAAPKQGREGAPDAEVHIHPAFRAALEGVVAGDRLELLTWLHHADRDALRVHPRDDAGAPLRGVFATRSADRPNPIGGLELYRPNDFAARGITLRFLRSRPDPYPQGGAAFQPYLSIIDVMMFNSKDEISAILKNGYDIVEGKDV